MEIRSSTSLRNQYNEISDYCKQTGEPIFLTKNGDGDLVVMSIDAFKKKEEILKIKEALLDSVYQIVRTVKNVLEQTPPELSADIIEKGIVLTGGGALLNGLDKLLEKELKVNVKVAENPLSCVAEGTGILLSNLYLIER